MRINSLLLITVYIISILIDTYIYFTIPSKNLGKGCNKFSGRKIYLYSSIICLAFLTAAICLPRRELTNDITPIMWMLYAFATIYISKFTYVVFSLIGRLLKVTGLPNNKTDLYIGLPIAILVFITLWWGALVTRTKVEVTHVTISSSKLPDSFDGYKIVQFSDAHVGTWGNDTAFISTLVDSINNLKPDLIVFTGDIVNRSTDEIVPFTRPLSRLKARDGVYSILGNHDYGDYMNWETIELQQANNLRLHKIEQQMGWTMLNNDHAYIINSNNDTIVLIGVENLGDPPFKNYGNLKKAYPNSKDRFFKILLSHNPVHWDKEVISSTDINLTLSGHTHAFQLRIGNWSPSVWRYRKWGGLYSTDDDSQFLYVNIGCGEVGIPSRIGATPEITQITLHK